MKPRRIGWLTVLAVACAASRALAGDGDEVRVYTNADIDRLAPLPSQREPLVGFDRERWEYVIQFLEREHERLDADRNHDLARAMLRAEVEAARQSPRYGLALPPHAGFYGRRYGTPGQGTGRQDPPRPAPADSFATPPGERIVPLHARPSRARQHFDRAARQAGD